MSKCLQGLLYTTFDSLANYMEFIGGLAVALLLVEFMTSGLAGFGVLGFRACRRSSLGQSVFVSCLRVLEQWVKASKKAHNNHTLPS